MNWLTRLIPSIGKGSSKSKKSKIPDGVWTSCPSCESALYKPELQKTLYVCPKCDHHLRIGSRTRFNIFFDNGNFTEIASNVCLLYTSPSPRDRQKSRMPSSA